MVNLKHLFVAVACLCSTAANVRAAELTIWAGGAVKSAASEAIADFGKSANVTVNADFAPMGTLIKRLADDQAVSDVVILSAEAMAEAVTKGWVKPDSIVEFGRVGIGVAVNEKAPSPDITTAAAFKATLLAASSIIIVDPSTGTSGKYLAGLFERLGVAEAIKPRLKTLPGGYVVEPVGKGEVELGIHQITEILPVKGVKLVGPLPPELQSVTIYQAAARANAANAASAKAFLDYTQTAPVRASLAGKGFTSR